jgi:hypothetical protein
MTKRGDYYPAASDEYYEFVRSFRPLNDADVMLQVLKNGLYLFDDKFMFIQAMPWLMSHGMLCFNVNQNLTGSSLREYMSFKANNVLVMGPVDDPIRINYTYTGFSYTIPWMGVVKETLRRANLGKFYDA